MPISALQAVYRLGYEISPILLTGGLMADIPFGAVPIVALLEGPSIVNGALGGNFGAPDLDNFFARFIPAPGGTIISNAIGEYPFANQAVAANATIAQPLDISLRMICPARGPGGYSNKTSTLIALKSTLELHIQSGGTFTVITPGAIYPNSLLLDLRDITGGDTRQAQSIWQWTFRKPLLTSESAASVMSQMMDKITNGSQLTGNPTWSGAIPSIGVTGPQSAPIVGAQATGALIASSTPAISPVVGVR